MKKLLKLVCAAGVAAILAACDGGSSHSGGGGHHHAAPHGGTLVELGEHQFNVEFVLDATAGTLTAYVLDGHAENFIRIPSGSWMVEARVGEQTESLTFVPQSNAATGEIIGNTSQYMAQADWLKTAAAFAATIQELDIKGTKYTGVVFNFPN